MNYHIDIDYEINNNNILNIIKELNDMYLQETYKGNKVAYLYQDKENIISYNKNICFYAASSIKILVCLYLFLEEENSNIDLNKKILITMNDLKQDTGIIKYQRNDTYYTILDLIKLTLVESDNTAYIKLVDLVGKNNLKQFGKSLGAKYTMVGKDEFGLINCNDMLIYWKNIINYIEGNNKYSNYFKEYLLKPSVKLIDINTLNNSSFLRKYGSWDIAIHECGYVLSNNPFYLIVLTQLNKEEYKSSFMNETAKRLIKINKLMS